MAWVNTVVIVDRCSRGLEGHSIPKQRFFRLQAKLHEAAALKQLEMQLQVARLHLYP